VLVFFDGKSVNRKIVESYKRKLALEEGWQTSSGADLRIALCYPNTHAIGMANLGLHTMYELFNGIPGVSCERVFLPDAAELKEYERFRTQLLSLETQSPVRDFDVVAFTISFETDYLNMARMLQLSGIPVWSAERNERHPLIVMGGAASFLNPEPIADFTDVIAVARYSPFNSSTPSSRTGLRKIFFYPLPATAEGSTSRHFTTLFTTMTARFSITSQKSKAFPAASAGRLRPSTRKRAPCAARCAEAKPNLPIF
jgi:hypothetical protein